MRYRPLGSTGLVVSELAFGAMTFGTTMPPITKVDAALADRLVGIALDAGVNLFDTADTYALGESERLLGQALKSRRHEVVIATKYGFSYGGVNEGGLSARHTIASAEASLRRLGTDFIDLLQLHKPDPLTPIDETVTALDNLVRRGLVRYVGLCNFPAWEVALGMGAQRAAGLVTLSSTQVYWSLVGRDVEEELVPLCEAVGLGVLVWSPLAGGYLAGPASGAGRRASWAFPPVDDEIGARALTAVDQIVTGRGLSRARVALAWLLDHPVVSSVIVGASTPEQLADNLGATDVDLSREERRQLDQATSTAARYPRWLAQELPDPVRQGMAAGRRTPPPGR